MKKMVLVALFLGCMVGKLCSMAPKAGAANLDARSVSAVDLAHQIDMLCRAKTGYFGPRFFYKLLFAAIAAQAGYTVACDVRKMQDVSSAWEELNYWPICVDGAVFMTALAAFFMTPAWQSLYNRGIFIARAAPHIAKVIVANPEARACLSPELLRGMREELSRLDD